MPSPERGGTGMVMVMGLWNFLLRGSTVTMGLNVALLPMIFFTVSSGTGWVWESIKQLIIGMVVDLMYFFKLHFIELNKGKQKHGFLLDLMIFFAIISFLFDTIWSFTNTHHPLASSRLSHDEG